MEIPSDKDLEAYRILGNSKPHEEFLGLSPNDMHDLIYMTFDSDSILKINPDISGEVLNQIPYFRLTEEFLKIIERDGFVKLTPLGALPKKFLVELYNLRILLDESIELGIHKLSREVDSLALSSIHINTEASGLVYKRNGRLILTKAGSKLLGLKYRNKLFIKLLQTFTEKIAWSTFDLYPRMPIGQIGWGFTIILLLKFGKDLKGQHFYAEKYLKAFPSFQEAFPLNNPIYSSPGQALARAYCLRSFERFLELWGFVRTSIQKSPLFRDASEIQKTDILDKVFSIDPKLTV